MNLTRARRTSCPSSPYSNCEKEAQYATADIDVTSVHLVLRLEVEDPWVEAHEEAGHQRGVQVPALQEEDRPMEDL